MGEWMDVHKMEATIKLYRFFLITIKPAKNRGEKKSSWGFKLSLHGVNVPAFFLGVAYLWFTDLLPIYMAQGMVLWIGLIKFDQLYIQLHMCAYMYV